MKIFAKLSLEPFISYRHGPYRPFIVYDPKQRSISRASLKDRFVHHLVYKALVPIFCPRFFFHSLSCQEGKGTHLGIHLLNQWLHQVSSNGTKPCFSLKMDIRRFFDSINHALLKQLVRRQVTDQKLLRLIDQIIDSFHLKVTSHGKVGLPLGNVTSQLFANIYLHELDHFVKHTLKRKHYLRYCDDFIFLANSKSELLSLIPLIQSFLRKKLFVELHPQKIILRKLHQGIDFLGVILFEHHKLLRTKTKRRMIRKLQKGLREYQQGKKSLISMDGRLQSYLGALRHANQHAFSEYLKNAFGVRPKKEL